MWMRLNEDHGVVDVDVSDTQQLHNERSSYATEDITNETNNDNSYDITSDINENSRTEEGEHSTSEITKLDTIDDTCEEDESGFDFVIIKEWTWRTCLGSRYGVVSIYIMLTLILLSAFLVLVIVITMVCMPYGRVSGFLQADCEVTGAHTYPTPSICSCGKGCDSHYPCLVIRVQYTDDNGHGHNASIHDNEVILGKRVSMIHLLW